MNHHQQTRTDAGNPAAEHSRGPTVDALGGSTRLGPGETFPADLGSLTLAELQVLHSRVFLQLEDEHLDAPAGPHPVTLDRHQELMAALDTHRDARGVTAGE
ncbi:hypothetical protein [Kocuria sp. KH4]